MNTSSAVKTIRAISIGLRFRSLAIFCFSTVETHVGDDQIRSARLRQLEQLGNAPRDPDDLVPHLAQDGTKRVAHVTICVG